MTVVHEAACAAPVARLWEALTDLGATTGPVPLTTAVAADPGLARLGWGFTARTTLGPLRVDDTMLVTSARPPAGDRPGVLRVVKTGRLLDGWAEVEVWADGPARSRLRWSETVLPRPALLRALTPSLLAEPATAAMLRRITTDLVARAEGLETSGTR